MRVSLSSILLAFVLVFVACKSPTEAPGTAGPADEGESDSPSTVIRAQRTHTRAARQLPRDATTHRPPRKTAQSRKRTKNTFAPPFTITGTAFDKDTSEPLMGALISTVAAARDTTVSVVSDANGQFTITDVPPRTRSLSASLDGFAVATELAPPDSNGNQRISIRPPTSSTVVLCDIPFVAVVKLSGRVQDQQHQPIAGAEVELSSIGTGTRINHRAKTDDGGRFQFRIIPFQSLSLGARAPGYFFYRTPTVTDFTREKNDFVITLDRCGVIEGKVVNPADEGVPNAVVSSLNGFNIGNGFFADKQILATSQSDGRFRIDSMPAAPTLALRAFANGYAGTDEDVALPRPGQTEHVKFVLQHPLSISGRLVDESGNPAPGTVSTRYTFDHTDSDGNFLISGLPAGEMTILGRSADGLHGRQVVAKAGSENVLIQFVDSPSIIHLSVIDFTTRQPITEFTVSGTPTTRDGEPPNGFRLVTPGNLERDLVVKSPGYLTRKFRVHGNEGGGEAQRELKMGRGSAVTGRIVDSDRQPIAGVVVKAADWNVIDSRNEIPFSSTVSDSEGRFTISKIPPGKLIVSALPAAPLASLELTVPIPDAESTDIGDLVLRKAARVHGRIITQATGEPLSYAMIRLLGMGPSPSFFRAATASADGSFAFDNLPPARYRLLAPGYEETVDLDPGANQEIIIGAEMTTQSQR